MLLGFQAKSASASMLLIIKKFSAELHLIVNFYQPAALNDILPVELQLSITGMTVGPTLGPEHCIIEQETVSQLPHSDPSYRRSLLVEVREGEREKERRTAL